MVPKKSFLILKRIPTDYYTHIGRFISRWAFLEWRIRRLTYVLLGVGNEKGRVAIREPRINDSITIVEDLMFLDNLVSPIDLAKMKATLVQVESNRDKLAHGLWIKHPNYKIPILRDTKGSHEQRSHMSKTARKAKIFPKQTIVNIEHFKNWVAVTDGAIRAIEMIGKSVVRQRRALHRKQLRQYHAVQAANLRERNRVRPKRLPLASGG